MPLNLEENISATLLGLHADMQRWKQRSQIKDSILKALEGRELVDYQNRSSYVGTEYVLAPAMGNCRLEYFMRLATIVGIEDRDAFSANAEKITSDSRVANGLATAMIANRISPEAALAQEQAIYLNEILK